MARDKHITTCIILHGKLDQLRYGLSMARTVSPLEDLPWRNEMTMQQLLELLHAWWLKTGPTEEQEKFAKDFEFTTRSRGRPRTKEILLTQARIRTLREQQLGSDERKADDRPD